MISAYNINEYKEITNILIQKAKYSHLSPPSDITQIYMTKEFKEKNIGAFEKISSYPCGISLHDASQANIETAIQSNVFIGETSFQFRSILNCKKPQVYLINNSSYGNPMRIMRNHCSKFPKELLENIFGSPSIECPEDLLKALFSGYISEDEINNLISIDLSYADFIAEMVLIFVKSPSFITRLWDTDKKLRNYMLTKTTRTTPETDASVITKFLKIIKNDN